MKKRNEDIDKMIKDALSNEEAKFYDELGEQSLPEMVGGLFVGKLKWLAVITMIAQVALFVAAVYCAYQFFQVEEVREMLKWGAGFFMFLMASSMLKIFHWMQMDKNALMREIKRMELQVVALNSKLEAQG